MIDIKINAKEVIDALVKLDDIMESEIAIESDKVSDKIVNEAKTAHRYKSKSGNLVEATKKELKIDRNSIKELYEIDDIKAPYGKYIHEGFKSWAADPYLENAVMRNEASIAKAVEDGIGNAIKKVGL